jgi:hypothetical protein
LAERAWIIGVVAFTVGRFVVAYSTLRQYRLNIWLFGFIDIITAVPYGVGTARLVLAMIDRKPVAAVRWGMVAAASFLAPYLYIAIAGQAMPMVVYVVLAALILLFGANAILSVRRDVRKRRNADTPTQTDEHIVRSFH